MVSLRGHQQGNLNIRKNIGNLLRMTFCVQKIFKNTTNYHDLGKTNTPRRMLKQQHGRKYNAGRKFTISWLRKYSMVKTNTRDVNLRYHDCEKYKKSLPGNVFGRQMNITGHESILQNIRHTGEICDTTLTMRLGTEQSSRQPSSSRFQSVLPDSIRI